jgi:hypothetical protein
MGKKKQKKDPQPPRYGECEGLFFLGQRFEIV